MSLPLLIVVPKNTKNQSFIRRSFWLANMLKELDYSVHWIVYKNSPYISWIQQNNFLFTQVSSLKEKKEAIKNTPAKMIILNQFYFSKKFCSSLSTSILSMDNQKRDFNHYTLDLFSGSFIDYTTNFKGQRYFVLPKNFESFQSPKKTTPIKKILVIFESSKNTQLLQLTQKVLKPMEDFLNINFYFQKEMYQKKGFEASLHILENYENLYKEIKESDLVITSFSQIAYEALFLGRPVFLINNNKKEQKIALKEGFPCVEMKHTKRVKKIQDKLKSFIAQPFFPIIDLPSKENLTLKIIFKTLLEIKPTLCPACKSTGHKVVKRESFFNLYYCQKDKIFFKGSNFNASTSYSSNYFVEDYKKQYGKTYEEDRPNIDRLNKDRLKTLQTLMPPLKEKRNLLEIGCALGFFLDLAQKTQQFNTKGIEISSYAVDYATKKLGLGVTQEDFLKTIFETPLYDSVAMWYYLEHNKNLDLLIQKVKESLKIGGILALSTPNAHGISARKNPQQYVSRIPQDHYFEFSPKGLTTYLQNNGFKLEKIKVTGIHPARWIDLPFSWLNPVLKRIMKKRKLGDTFEGYYKRVS